MNDDDEIEFTDRYKALGIPYPDPGTMCDGDCEGTGLVPTEHDKMGRYRELWEIAHTAAGSHPCDGWHFVKCPDCNGTGKR